MKNTATFFKTTLAHFHLQILAKLHFLLIWSFNRKELHTIFSERQKMNRILCGIQTRFINIPKNLLNISHIKRNMINRPMRTVSFLSIFPFLLCYSQNIINNIKLQSTSNLYLLFYLFSQKHHTSHSQHRNPHHHQRQKSIYIPLPLLQIIVNHITIQTRHDYNQGQHHKQ